MTTLNRAAAEALEALPAGAVHACTDVTGFGLIGHASEMAAASGCSLEIDAGAVPLLDGARELVRGNIPGGGRTNREHFGARVRRGGRRRRRPASTSSTIPQTSGGLLVAVDRACRRPRRLRRGVLGGRPACRRAGDRPRDRRPRHARDSWSV